MGDNILITGATGFVGQNVVKKLLEGDCTVYAIVRNESGLLEALNRTGYSKLHILKGDLLLEKDLKKIANELKEIEENVNFVIHLVGGGPLTVNEKFSKFIFDLNLTTTRNLIQILEESNKVNTVELFIYISSLAAMGALGPDRTYKETEDCYPILSYEKVKKETEDYLKKKLNKYNLRIVVLRPPQIYGDGAKEFIKMIKTIEGGIFPVVMNATGSLPLIHVNDVANAIKIILANHEKIIENFEIFLLCEKSYSYDELVEIVRKIFGKGGCIKLPFFLFYSLGWILEIMLKLVGKPEPINRYRVKSSCRERLVDCSKFSSTFSNYRFEQNLEKFLKELQRENEL